MTDNIVNDYPYRIMRLNFMVGVSLKNGSSKLNFIIDYITVIGYLVCVSVFNC